MKLSTINENVNASVWASRDDIARLARKLADEQPKLSLNKLGETLKQHEHATQNGTPHGATSVYALLAIAEILQLREEGRR